MIILPLPIETERLLVRAPSRKDMDAWVSLFTDVNASKYMKQPVDRSADQWWDRLKGRKPSIDLPLSVVEKLAHRCIGQAGYFEVKSDRSSVEVYCRLLPEFWRQGYGREICNALTVTAFGHLGYERVVGYVHPENSASISMLLHLGFVCCGEFDDPDSWQDGHRIYEKTCV